MLWRTYLINRLVGSHDIKAIVGRHPVVYVKILIQYMAVFLLLYLVWKVMEGVSHDPLVVHVTAVIAILLYIFAMYLLLRHYFDVIVATDQYLYVVLWDSFFRYHIKIVTRRSIQDITLMPASGISAMMRDAHILIATEQDDLIEFHHVYKATDVVRKLYAIRDHATHDEDELPEIAEQDIDVADDKFKILVETLGEVIVDYMKKKE